MKVHQPIKKLQKKVVAEGNPQNHKISVEIPAKVHQSDSKFQNVIDFQQAQISMLPLESARVVTTGTKKRKLTSQERFISGQGKGSYRSPLSVTRIDKIKNVVYRNKLEKRISQQKARRASLQETKMFLRERRFNKLEIAKKNQRFSSPDLLHQRNKKKYKRTDEKKGEQQKKFRRIKVKQDQPTDEQKMIQAKLIKKTREEAQMNGLTKIVEHNDQYTSLESSANVEFKIRPATSEAIQISIIEEEKPRAEQAPKK